MASTILHGNGVVPGIGSGPVVRPRPRPEVPTDEDSLDPEVGVARFTEAASAVADRLAARAEQPLSNDLAAIPDPVIADVLPIVCGHTWDGMAHDFRHRWKVAPHFRDRQESMPQRVEPHY